MFALIFVPILILGAVFAFVNAGRFRSKINRLSGGEARYNPESDRFSKLIWTVVGGVLIAISAFVLGLSTIYTQSVGEAKVIVNVDGTISHADIDPGLGFKAPWQDSVDFDLFSQELLYAGGDAAPSYSGGQVTGKEVTVSVGGLNGGSTQANVDVSVTYSLDADAVEEIYAKYKSQERFTKQVIEKTVLSAVRTAPSDYTAIEFRGAKKDAAAQAILDRVNDKLNALGVTVDFVNIQAVRYPDNVETALNDVEAANQKAAQAEANQRTAEVEAETKRIEAQGVADANAILNVSLTPEVLTQKYIEALKAGTVFVVPEGSTPLVTTSK